MAVIAKNMKSLNNLLELLTLKIQKNFSQIFLIRIRPSTKIVQPFSVPLKTISTRAKNETLYTASDPSVLIHTNYIQMILIDQIYHI